VGKRLLVLAALIGIGAGASWTVRSRDTPDPVTPETVILEDVEQRLGPYSLGPLSLPSQDFVVVLRDKRLPDARPDNPDGTTIASIEIVDAGGTVRYEERIAYSVERGSFAESCSASVDLLKGSVASGLLIGVGCVPSAPDAGDTWEIFGLVNGRLMRFGKPFTTTGELVGLLPTPVARSGNAVSIRPDVLQLKIWTGNFRVTAPVRVDWLQGRLLPGERCFHQTDQGLREEGCELAVDVERHPVSDEMTFVRLFVEPDDGMGIPQHVVVGKDSKVEFLAARVKIDWDDTQDVVFLSVDDAFTWLRVRIDGKEGWVHTQEDFAALGVPQAG
jgi:hypothetical protein